jgi:hypothetical protein
MIVIVLPLKKADGSPAASAANDVAKAAAPKTAAAQKWNFTTSSRFTI